MKHSPPNRKQMKILILRGGALGDFLLTLPCITMLRTRWPDAWITLVGNSTAAQLALIGGEIQEVHSQHEARWAALYGSGPLPSELKNWLGKFDLVLCFWPDPEGELATRFPLATNQTVIYAAARPCSAPAARHFCEALKPLGISVPAHFHHRLRAFQRQPSPEALPLISIHPGSSSQTRNWPAPQWAALARIIDGQGASILLISGEADKAELDAFSDIPLEHAHNWPLPVLATRMAQCQFHVGHDTGISHLAASLGIPSLVLFGPSEPAIWAPQGTDIQTLKSEGLIATLPMPHVLKALSAHGRFPITLPQP